MIHGTHIIGSFDKDLLNINSNLIKSTNLIIEQLTIIKSNYKNISKAYNNINELVETLKSKELEVNKIHQSILNRCINILTLRNPLAWDLRFVFISSHVIRNLERNAGNSYKIFLDLTKLENHIDEIDEKNIEVIDIVLNMLASLVEAFEKQNYKDISIVNSLDDKVDKIFEEICNLLIIKIQKDPKLLVNFYTYLSVAKRLERLGDHIVSMGKYLSFVDTGVLEV